MRLLAVGDFISGVESFFETTFMQGFLDILSFIPKLVYFIVTCFLSLIDLFQVIFRKLAGLDVVMISGEAVKGDPVYSIISDAIFTGKYPAISTTFWSLIILGIIMVFATTFISVIRVEIVPDKEKKNNSKETIIRNFFVALFNFAFVPISCIFGLFLGNAMVSVIDSAISANEVVDEEMMEKFDKWTWADYGADGGDALINQEIDKDFSSYIAFDIFGYHVPTTMEPFSATIFKACATQCNRLNKYGEEYLDALNNVNALGIFDGSITDSGLAADLIDTGFMYSAKLKSPQNLNYEGMDEFCRDPILKNLFGDVNNHTSFDRYDVTMVWYFYDLWTFNYIVAFTALAMMVKMYWQFALALMARLFEITGLFLIAPIPVAITPLDGGGTLQRWRARFYAKFCLMVIMVMGLNLINPLISLVKDLKLFNIAFLDYIVLAFFIIAALNAMDSLNQTLSYILFDRFGQDEYKESKNMAGNIQRSFNTGLAMAGKTGSVVAGAPLWAAGKVAGGAVGLARHGIYNAKEDRAIKKGMKFNAAKEEANFAAMSTDERRRYAAHFENNNKNFYKKFQGATDEEKKKNMREAFENNDFSKLESKYKENDIRAQIYRARHDENLFKHSGMASGLTEGSEEYYKALNKFNKMDHSGKVRSIRGGEEALTDTQREIRYKRENPPAKVAMERFKGKVAKLMGKVDKTFKPVTDIGRNILGSMFNEAWGITKKKDK